MVSEVEKTGIYLNIRGKIQSKLAEIFTMDKSKIYRLVKKCNDLKSILKSFNRGRNSLTDERGYIMMIWKGRINRRHILNKIVYSLINMPPILIIYKNKEIPFSWS